MSRFVQASRKRVIWQLNLHRIFSIKFLAILVLLVIPKLLSCCWEYSRHIRNNLSFQANCAGRTDDLALAISDYTSRDFDVVVDSVFEGTNIQPFLERTYVSSARFGKVVY